MFNEWTYDWDPKLGFWAIISPDGLTADYELSLRAARFTCRRLNRLLGMG